jgi:hypothetical protein
MRVRNWISLVVGTAVALACSYQAYTLANASWNQVVDYRSPYAKVELADTPAPGRSQLKTTRVVYVIVDGLRDDVSRAMPSMQRLRDGGYDAVVRTSEPSLSFPNWTTLLSGASQRISGVTTNWFEGRVPVETLVDVALRSKREVVVSAPKDFEMLYGVERTGHAFLRDWTKGSYMAAELVDNAIRLAGETTPTLVIVHLPDIDEAGHAFGGSSPEYLAMAKRVDTDLGRLVAALQDGTTAFVVASDHGHIATGGHGGWEPEVIDVPAVFAGPDVRLGKGSGTQDQVAGAVALLAGLPAPRNAMVEPLIVTVGTPDLSRFALANDVALRAAIKVVQSEMPAGSTSITTPANDAARAFELVTQDRLAVERGQRLPLALGLAGAALAVLVAIGLLSWRALVSALGGTVFYYLVYNGLFFLLHGNRWSLSSFNSEELLKSFFNGRMVDAVIAGVLAAFVAADIYLVTRKEPRRPKGEFLAGWLALGTATVLTIQATLALQVAWYLWRWGVAVAWVLPDFKWAFKYDLDLIQGTAIGALAILGPVVTYLVGRYHPIRKSVASTATTSAADEPQSSDEGA